MGSRASILKRTYVPIAYCTVNGYLAGRFTTTRTANNLPQLLPHLKAYSLVLGFLASDVRTVRIA